MFTVHYGIVEFDIFGNKIGYVVSGSGSQGGGFGSGQNPLHYRADAGIIFDLENLSFDVVNYGNRYANKGSSGYLVMEQINFQRILLC